MSAESIIAVYRPDASRREKQKLRQILKGMSYADFNPYQLEEMEANFDLKFTQKKKPRGRPF